MTKREDLRQILSPFLDRNLGFPLRPKLIPDLCSFSMPDGLGLQVRGSEKNFVLRGRLVETVMPWALLAVDGHSTIEELLRRRPADISAEDAAQAIFLAFRRGLLQDSENYEEPAQIPADATVKRQLLFWGRNLGSTRFNSTSGQVQSKLSGKKLVLIADGFLGAATFDILVRSCYTDIVLLEWASDQFLADTFSNTDFSNNLKMESLGRSLDQTAKRLRHWLPASDLLITATRNAPQLLFELINRECLAYQRKWLRGNDNGSSIEIGPYVDPFYSPCFACMIARQSCAIDQAIEEELYQVRLAETPGAEQLVGETIACASIGAGFLSAEATRILTEIHLPAFDGAVLSITNGGALDLNHFKRVPRCPECYKGGRCSISEQTLHVTI